MSYGRRDSGVAGGWETLNERRTARQLRVLSRATHTFLESDQSRDQLLDVVVRELAQTSDSLCAVLLLTKEGRHFTAPYAYGPDPMASAALRADLPAGRRRLVETHPGLRSVVESRTPRVLPLPSPGSEKGTIASQLVVPLIVGDHVLGAFELIRRGEDAPPFDEDDVSIAQGLAEHVGLALTAKELLQKADDELRERRRMAARLQVLSETSQEFAAATAEYDHLLAAVARRLTEAVGDLCSVRAISEDGQVFEDGAVHHADPKIASWVAALLGEPQRAHEGITGRVTATGQPLFIPNLTREDWAATLPRYRQIFERLQVGGLMMVPLSCRGEVVGVASLLRSGFDNPYTTDDLRLVKSVADHAALAISNARSYRAERAARAATMKAHEAIRQSEVGHRLLFESSPVPVLAFSVDSLEILAANRAALRLYGYSHDEMLAMKLSDLRVDVGQAAMNTILTNAGDADLTGVARQRRKDASEFFVEYHSLSLVFRGHQARMAAITDVTGRIEADRMRSLLSAIVQSSNDAIVSEDLTGTITSWNNAAERLYGYTREEAVGKPTALLVPNEALDQAAELLATVATGEPVSNHETLRRRKDGSMVHVSLSLSPIIDPSGKVIGASKTVRDLTAQIASSAALRAAEDQLRQAQKMEAVGRLAGGIAHDFNNALSVIIGYSDLMLRDLPADDLLRESVDEIRQAAGRAADLTRQLLVFSRQQVVAPRILDLNRVLADMDRMLRRIIGEDIDLVSSPGLALGQVRADPSQIDQVIMNLVVNARDAMPTGGKLTIETANVELDAHYAKEHLGAGPGPYVMLAVSDTGHGMDSATQARIFEPFFTTKETGKGTGLGLSTVFGIAQQAGGSVWVYSELGKGTTFKVYFPRVQTELDTQTRVRPRQMLQGTETILLVEDQDDVRAVAHVILKLSGYHVIVARTASEALVLSQQHRGLIHLLLTDVVMPQQSGLELAKRIAMTRPETRLLYMSGYTDDSIVRHGVLESTMAFLQKPFTPETLATRVREVLDAPEP